VLRLPEVKEKFAASGTDAIGNTPQEFDRMIQRELEQNKKVIQAVGMKAD
jgi:tripartite-type tricarboxylate transporter receptor subunit TctC